MVSTVDGLGTRYEGIITISVGVGVTVMTGVGVGVPVMIGVGVGSIYTTYHTNHLYPLCSLITISITGASIIYSHTTRIQIITTTYVYENAHWLN